MSAVLYSVESGLATIMLDRPEARNALNGAMCDELCAAATRAAADPSVRLVLVRGNGPVFCAGMDLREVESRGGLTDPENDVVAAFQRVEQELDMRELSATESQG